MSRIVADSDVFSSLKGKTVVITGGATGIGRAFVLEAHRRGANVVVADMAAEAGESLAASLGPSVLFVRCNTTSYQDQLSVFGKAQETFGNIDVVIANAGMADFADPFAPTDDITSEPHFRELDVNLRGVMFTARIGMHYLRKSGGGDLVLVSSIAGFKESAEMTPYLASKHGVIGLMRGLRLSTLPQGIRVNVICPWMTKTGMVKGIEKGWMDLNLPVNEAEDVARAMFICATSNSEAARNSHFKDQPPFHGKILFVAGGESYEIEDKLQALEPQWLGEENSRVLKLGQDYLHNGSTSWGN